MFYFSFVNGERTVLTENNSKEYARQLVSRAQNGDSGALELLKDLYMPLLRGACSRHFSDGMQAQDSDELFGEALIAFCKAVLAYDLSVEGVEFGLYARICVDNALISYRRAFERRSRFTSISLDALDGNRYDEVDLIDSLVARENAADLARMIRSLLSAYENRVWWLYVAGLSAKDISLRIGTDERSVHNAIYRIRRKLRDIISEK